MNGKEAFKLNNNVPWLCDTCIEESNNHISDNFHINKYNSNYHCHTKASTTHQFTLPKMQYHQIIPNSSSFEMDTKVDGIKVTYTMNHYLGSLCGEISNVVNTPRTSNSIHTDQKKYSSLTMNMAEENVMARVVPDEEKSKLKSNMVPMNNLYSTSVRKVTSSWCIFTSTLSTHYRLPTANITKLWRPATSYNHIL